LSVLYIGFETRVSKFEYFKRSTQNSLARNKL
jgi:hypothetical protein